MLNPKVVITGIGAVTPHGIGKEALWERASAGQLSLQQTMVGENGLGRKIVAGQVPDFRADSYVPQKIIKQTDRSTHMAMAASQLAMKDGKLDLGRVTPSDVGMYFSTLFGGMEFAEPELYAQAHISPDRVSAYQAIAWFYAATQGQWSILSQLKGYAKTVVADRAGGLQALSWASMAIQQGHCKVMFAGGFDAPLVPYTLLIHKASGLLSSEDEVVDCAYRPFDVRRSGMVLAEGAGILMLEDVDHAITRGASVYAELAGFSTCADKGWRTSNSDSRLADCVRQALDRAGLQASDVDHVMAEGVGTQADDAIEAEALRQVFGTHQPTVSAPKSMTGHMLSAAGPIDCACACLMIQEGKLLPTASLDLAAPECDLNHVRRTQPAAQLNNVLCVSRGYGGTNAAIVLKRFCGAA